ncbi:MAG TPA: TraB/GumN family protein [Chthoniobacterales bacterium]
MTNAPQPFYLLGSVHALRKSDYPLPREMEDAVRQCRTILCEVDPNETNTFARLLFESARYPRGETMRGKVHPETYSYLQKMAQKSHINLNRYNILRPWAIAIAMFKVPGFEGVSNSQGVDAHFVAKSREEHKQTGGLESAAAHVGVFGGMSDEESEVVLLRAIIDADKESQEYSQTLAAWRAGDTKRLWDLDTRFRVEAPSIHHRILENRNAAWIPRIESAIKSGTPTVVIAGALHFCGPNGVPALLQARGHKLEQL